MKDASVGGRVKEEMPEKWIFNQTEIFWESELLAPDHLISHQECDNWQFQAKLNGNNMEGVLLGEQQNL